MQQFRRAREELLLVAGLDVRGQENAARRVFQAQHAAHVVGLAALARVVGGVGVEHREAHAIPLPGLAGHAALTLQFGQRAEQAADRQGFADRHQATRMILVAMGDDQRVEAVDTGGAQVGDDDALPGVRLGAVQWPGVVEQRVPGGAYDHRQPLPDVEHIDPGVAGHRSWGRPEQRRQQQAEPRPARRKTTWQQQAQDPEQGQQRRRQRWCRLLPQGPAREPFEKHHQKGQ